MKTIESQLRHVIRQQINESIEKGAVYTVSFNTNGIEQSVEDIHAYSLEELLQKIISIQDSYEERFKKFIEDHDEDPEDWEDEWLTMGVVIGVNGVADDKLLSYVNDRLSELENM